MEGVAIYIDDAELEKLARRVGFIARTAEDQDSLKDALGAELTTQTKRRLEEEKSSPAGVAWKDWSKSYAKTRHGGHSLLINEGHLTDSIQHNVLPGGVEVGSNLVYARIHQTGGTIQRRARSQVNAHGRGGRFRSRRSASKQRTGAVAVSFANIGPSTIRMPARPYLGISGENAEDIHAIVDDWMENVLGVSQ